MGTSLGTECTANSREQENPGLSLKPSVSGLFNRKFELYRLAIHHLAVDGAHCQLEDGGNGEMQLKPLREPRKFNGDPTWATLLGSLREPREQSLRRQVESEQHAK